MCEYSLAFEYSFGLFVWGIKMHSNLIWGQKQGNTEGGRGNRLRNKLGNELRNELGNGVRHKYEKGKTIGKPEKYSMEKSR